MTDPNSLAGQTVCVTGASSGLGRAIAERLGSLGAHVFMMGRKGDPMQESAEKIIAAGGEADIAIFDVTNTPELQRWIEAAAQSTGRLDVLVNNAGFGQADGSFVDADPAVWRSMLEVNVLAVAVGCQAAIKAMRATGSEGKIINMSSVSALSRESGVYGGTKSAVNVINSSLRRLLEDDPIRVTAIMPGAFATNFFTRHMDQATVESFAERFGIGDIEVDDDGHAPQDQIDRIQAAMNSSYGNAEYVAEAVEFVVTQPIHINIEELVVRPQKSLLS